MKGVCGHSCRLLRRGAAQERVQRCPGGGAPKPRCTSRSVGADRCARAAAAACSGANASNAARLRPAWLCSGGRHVSTGAVGAHTHTHSSSKGLLSQVNARMPPYNACPRGAAPRGHAGASCVRSSARRRIALQVLRGQATIHPPAGCWRWRRRSVGPPPGSAWAPRPSRRSP